MTYKCQRTLGKYITHLSSGTVERSHHPQMYLLIVLSPNIQMPIAQDRGHSAVAAANKLYKIGIVAQPCNTSYSGG